MPVKTNQVTGQTVGQIVILCLVLLVGLASLFTSHEALGGFLTAIGGVGLVIKVVAVGEED